MPQLAQLDDFEEFRAIYTDKNFDLGIDDQRRLPYAVVVKIADLTKADLDDVAEQNEVKVSIVPTYLTDEAKKVLVEAGVLEADKLEDPMAIATACDDYGFRADVTEFVQGVDLNTDEKFADVIKRDDYEEIRQWVLDNGAKMSSAFRVGLGFALEREANEAGETGWDQLGPHVKEDYSSPTMDPFYWKPPAGGEALADIVKRMGGALGVGKSAQSGYWQGKPGIGKTQKIEYADADIKFTQDMIDVQYDFADEHILDPKAMKDSLEEFNKISEKPELVNPASEKTEKPYKLFERMNPPQDLDTDSPDLDSGLDL